MSFRFPCLTFLLGCFRYRRAIGPGVTHSRKATKSMLPGWRRSGKGTYAEYVVVKETEAALKPKSIDHIHARCHSVVALTAWQALFEQLD